MTTSKPAGDGLPWLPFRLLVLCLALLLLAAAGTYSIATKAMHSMPAATLTHQTVADGTIGTTGHLRPVPDYDYSILFVDEGGLSAWNHAYDNRDSKGESQVLSIYETLRIADNTPVKVTTRRRDTIQVELLSGEYAGRRGWTDPLNLIP
jgi:hypothetical protein